MFHEGVLRCHPRKRSDLETSGSRTAVMPFTGHYFDQLRLQNCQVLASYSNNCHQLIEQRAGLSFPPWPGRWPPCCWTLYLCKNLHTEICVYVWFPSSFLWRASCWQSSASRGSRWKAAPSNTTTKSNGAWLSPSFMTPETHFNLVTQLLDFLCRSDHISLFPCHLISISLDLVPPPACLLPWYHPHFSPSSVRLLTEMRFLIFLAPDLCHFLFLDSKNQDFLQTPPIPPRCRVLVKHNVLLKKWYKYTKRSVQFLNTIKTKESNKESATLRDLRMIWCLQNNRGAAFFRDARWHMDKQL